MADEPAKPSPLRSVHTTTLAELLNQGGFSFLVSTYQAGKLIVVRADGKEVNTHFRNFHTPMGVAFEGGRLAVGTNVMVWEFHNQPVVAKQLEPEGQARRLLPAAQMPVTGQHPHSRYRLGRRGVVGGQHPLFLPVHARQARSFVPRWRPTFISGYASEDRCHLNGLGLRDGQPQYVTALGETDVAGRLAREQGDGRLPDRRGQRRVHFPRADACRTRRAGTTASSGFSNPAPAACPRSISRPANSSRRALPGFTRGLDFFGPYALHRAVASPRERRL